MQEFFYKLADDETYCVTGYNGDEVDVVIPDTYLGKPVTVLFDCLFRYHKEIQTVRIPDSVTDIGEFVFDGCENLHRITLPGSLQYIWQYAFVRSGLEEVILPPDVQMLAPFTFKDCKLLKRVVCNEHLRKIHAWAFQGCVNLKEFIHGDKTEISGEAFGSTELNA